MILPLSKLIALQGNRYIFCKGAMAAIDKLGNIDDYPEDDPMSWKLVPNILKMMLDEDIKYILTEDIITEDDQDKDE